VLFFRIGIIQLLQLIKSLIIVKASETNLKDNTSEAMSATLGLNLTGYDVKGTALDRRWLLDISASKAGVDYADKRFDGTQDTEVSAALQLFF